MNHYFKFGLVLLSFSALTACAGTASRDELPKGASPEDIYDESYREGARNTIELLREGLKERRVYGVTDPYLPLRRPDEIVPIWVVDDIDPRTGRRIAGHWEHSILRKGGWSLE